MSEVEYLQARRRALRGELRAHARALRQRSRAIVDVPGYVSRHPRRGLALGALAGFFIGATPRERLPRPGAELHRALARGLYRAGRAMVMGALAGSAV